MSAITRSTADVIVIGGGLQGCSVALNLMMRGLKPTIVERNYIASHASGVNAGGVRRLGRHLAEIPLANAALNCWRNIEEWLNDDCGFVAPGQIKVAENETELQALVMRERAVQELGFSHEEIIDKKQLQCLLPAIAPHCVGGLYVNGDGYANPLIAGMAFRRKLISMGVPIFENSPVTDIQEKANTWQVTSTTSVFNSPAIVNCAGAWASPLARLLGDDIHVEARALMLAITTRLPQFIKPVVGAQGRALSFKQFENGTVLIGGAHEGRLDLQQNRTHLEFAGLATNIQSAIALFPHIHRASIQRCWAGIEGFMPDGLPVISQGSNNGVFHAFGFSAHGFALSPIVGQIIADLVTTGRTDLPIDEFRVDRFSNNSSSV